MHFDTDQFLKRTSGKLSLRDSSEYHEAHEAAKKLFALTNTMGGDHLAIAVADAFNQEHRTLQQAAIRDIVKPILMLLDWNGDTGAFDARNEGSVKWARAALEATESKELPLI